MKNLLSFFLLFYISSSLFAIKGKKWYQGLRDKPGVTLQEFSNNKILPVLFLKNAGLKDKEKFQFKIKGIKLRGDEEVIGTKVDIENQKLTLDNVVMFRYYEPEKGKEDFIWNKDFSPSSNIGKLITEKKLKKMGYVARLTLSHKRPDKALRFRDFSFLKEKRASISGKNVCQSASSIKSHGGDKEGIKQRSIPYGLWRLSLAHKQKRIFLVEGESTALTLWYHGIPALSFGGATKWHDNFISYLKGIKNIYFLLEPDSGGKELLKCLRKLSKEEEPYYKDFTDKVKLATLGSFGDASEMHLEIFESLDDLEKDELKGKFFGLFSHYTKKAVALNDPGYNQRRGKKQAEKIATFDPSKREVRKYTEDVGTGILSGKPKAIGTVYKKDEITPTATLQDYSRKKYFSKNELISMGFKDSIYPHQKFGPIFGVTMPTYKKNDSLNYYRFRISMDSKQRGSDRFPSILFNTDGSIFNGEPTIFALNLVESLGANSKLDKGSLIFVEGESDAITMLHYDYPALGIPGTGSWNDEWANDFDGVNKIIVTVEDDTGGDHFLEVLTALDKEGKAFYKKIFLIDFTDSGKDPSDLHTELTKDLKITAGDFYIEDQYKEEREHIENIFDDTIKATIRKGLFWHEVAGKFKIYEKNNENFYKEQWLTLKEKHKERQTCEKEEKEKCPTHQKVDAKYMPWPYIDFYNHMKGRKIKDYYNEKGEINSNQPSIKGLN